MDRGNVLWADSEGTYRITWHRHHIHPPLFTTRKPLVWGYSSTWEDGPQGMFVWVADVACVDDVVVCLLCCAFVCYLVCMFGVVRCVCVAFEARWSVRWSHVIGQQHSVGLFETAPHTITSHCRKKNKPHGPNQHMLCHVMWRATCRTTWAMWSWGSWPWAWGEVLSGACPPND